MNEFVDMHVHSKFSIDALYSFCEPLCISPTFKIYADKPSSIRYSLQNISLVVL